MFLSSKPTLLLALSLGASTISAATGAVAAQPTAAPAQTVPAPESCVPACRSGFQCVQGRCVSNCNPPCGNNETCTDSGQCVATASPASNALAPQPVAQPVAQPTVQPAPVASAPYAQAPVQEQGSSAESPPVELAPTAAENTGLRFGQGLQVAFSVDNVFGYGHTWATTTPTSDQGQAISGLEVKSSSDTFTFLGSSDRATLSPRLGVDVVVKGFTIGGSLMYASNSGESTRKNSTSNPTVETKFKNAGTSAFGIGVRGGYVLMFNDYVGIWPRAGLSYQTATTKTYSYSGTMAAPVETENVTDASGVFVSPELMLVVSPVPHFAFLVGAGASIALTGSFTDKTGGVTGSEGDVSGGTGGLAVGVLGYL